MWKEIFSAAKRKMVGIFNGFLWNTNKEMIFRFKVFWVNMTWEKKSVLNEHEIVFEWKKKTTQYLKNNLKYGLVVEEDCK